MSEIVTTDAAVIQLTSPVETEAAEMVPLFSLDGTTYKIPAKIRPNVALGIMAKMEAEGPVSAEIAMLRTVLGRKAFEALIGHDGLTSDALSAISTRVTRVVFGALEDEGKG